MLTGRVVARASLTYRAPEHPEFLDAALSEELDLVADLDALISGKHPHPVRLDEGERNIFANPRVRSVRILMELMRPRVMAVDGSCYRDPRGLARPVPSPPSIPSDRGTTPYSARISAKGR